MTNEEITKIWLTFDPREFNQQSIAIRFARAILQSATFEAPSDAEMNVALEHMDVSTEAGVKNFARWCFEAATRDEQSADAVDAQRYRYLRTGEGEIFAVYGSNGVWGECGHMNIYDDQLDAEIDKAIAASAPKGDGND